MAKIDKPENVVNADNRKREFFDFYRRRRPEYFSDSEVRYEVPLTSELFDLQLSMLSTNKKHSQFERFVVALVRRLITPNISRRLDRMAVVTEKWMQRLMKFQMT